MAKFSDEQVKAALAGRRVVRRYPMPGAEGVEVGVRLLSDAELDSVRLEAAEFVKKNKVETVIDPEFFDRAIHRETISRAFVDPDQPDDAFFGSQKDVAELDSLTVRSLYELYIAHHQAMDPYLFCPEEDVERLVEQLGKSESSAGLLSLYDAPTLRSFVLSLACKLRATQPTPKSTTG